MPSYNHTELMGNLTRDCTIRFTDAGTAVGNFSIAVNRKYRKDNETVEQTDFLDIVCFGKTAESCGKYIGKGSTVFIDGRLQNRSWETPEGQKRNKVEVVANQVIFLSFKKNQGADGSQQERQDVPEVDSGEIPF